MIKKIFELCDKLNIVKDTKPFKCLELIEARIDELLSQNNNLIKEDSLLVKLEENRAIAKQEAEKKRWELFGKQKPAKKK